MFPIYYVSGPEKNVHVKKSVGEFRVWIISRDLELFEGTTRGGLAEPFR